MKHLPLEPTKSKRAPMTDSIEQLARLGVHPVGNGDYGGPEWEIKRTTDPDYPWAITWIANKATRLCCSLIECVRIIQEPEKAWGLRKGGAV